MTAELIPSDDPKSSTLDRREIFSVVVLLSLLAAKSNERSEYANCSPAFGVTVKLIYAASEIASASVPGFVASPGITSDVAPYAEPNTLKNSVLPANPAPVPRADATDNGSASVEFNESPENV